MKRLVVVGEVIVVTFLAFAVAGISALVLGELWGRSAGGPALREIRIGLSPDAGATAVAEVVRAIEGAAPVAEVAESETRGRRQLVIVAPEGAVDHTVAYRIVADADLATGEIRTWSKPPALTEEMLFGSPSMMATLLAVQSVVLAGIAWLMIGRRWRPDGDATTSLPGLLGAGILVGVAMMASTLVLTIVLEAVGLPAREQPWVGELFAGRSHALVLVIPWLVVLGPAAEELFFRGYVYRTVRSGAGIAAATIVSTVLFALVHMNPSAIGVYLLMGLVLAWSTERWRSLVVPWTAHTTNNLAALTLTMLAAG